MKALVLKVLCLYRMEDNYDLLEDILHGRKDPTNLPLPFLRYITKDFSKEQKIASGGFGEVYKVISIFYLHRSFKFPHNRL